MITDIYYGKMQSGRTTRLVDNAVQRFFKLNKGEKMLIYDHSNTKEGQEKLIKLFINRMLNEHPNENFEISEINNTIKRV